VVALRSDATTLKDQKVEVQIFHGDAGELIAEQLVSLSPDLYGVLTGKATFPDLDRTRPYTVRLTPFLPPND
jgi:hypothetical protein